MIGNVGGTGTASGSTLPSLAIVGYHSSQTISAAIDYRAIYTGYEKGGFVDDATQQGIFTSVSVHFQSWLCMDPSVSAKGYAMSYPTFRSLVPAGALAIAAALLLTPAAMAQSATKIGTLTCDVSGGVGLVVVEKQTMTCQFKPDNGGAINAYTGKIETFGLALGGLEKSHLIWGVIAQTNDAPAMGALAGKYVGASADAAFGPGLGANVLVGGSGNAFALQPISVEGEIGVNIAAGVTELTLTAAP